MISKKKLTLGAASLAATAAAGAVYARWIEPQTLTETHLPLRVPNLPDHLEGKTLIQLGDLHVSDRSHNKFLQETMRYAQSFNPDFVVYTGDFTSYESVGELGKLAEVLESAVIGSLGTVGVLGNHDYGYRWGDGVLASTICEIAEKAGISILRNEMMDLNGLRVMGMDELWGTNHRPFIARDIIKYTYPHLAVFHQPDGVDLDIWSDFHGPILSGHTHGGQVRIPFLPPIVLPVRNRSYWHGFYELDGGRSLYVNRGLGQTFPFRVSSLPELTIFTLEKV